MCRRGGLIALAALAVAFPALADDAPGAGADDSRRVASAAPLPAAEVAALLQEALPPAPRTAELTTHYYGIVRLDHQAHLARRTACRACHGSGPVTKIEVTPRVGHERCVGCHTAQASGPVACKGCHDLTPPTPPTVLSVTSTPAVRPAEPPPPTQEQLALLEIGERGQGSISAMKENTALSRVLETGGAAGRGTGISLRLSSRSDGLEISHSLERLVASADTRTFGLFGVGRVRPLEHRFALSAGGLAGFDVFERPGVALLPVLGARAGIDWTPPPSWIVRRFQLSFTGLFDLGRADFGARRIGGWTGYATLSTGLGLSGSPP